MKNTIWFVTGASKGLGLALAKGLLESGAKVAVTSRTKGALTKELGESPNLLALEVDLGSETSVQAAIQQTIDRFGGLDVVVNNAGYGQTGALEEVSDREARANFEVNVFGALNVIRAAMPHLRAKRSGHIFNIASVGGVYGEFPGWGIYCATKFALAGLTEGLRAEAAELGVHVTLVYPGYFRTEFLGSGSLTEPKAAIKDYTAAHASQKQHSDSIHNNQPGDPDKLAAALMQVAEQANPPLHLFLGSDAVALAEKKIGILQEAVQANRAVSVSTDF